MSRRRVVYLPLLFAAWIAASELSAADETNQVGKILAEPILDPGIPLAEVRAFARKRIPAMPEVKSAEQWNQVAEQIRSEMLDKIVFRGQAAAWRDADLKIEWLETIEGGSGYKIRKLRYEALPGLWIPALLYMPDGLTGPAPVVMNVNGHDSTGKAADYKQLRCINQAKRGMIALNPEWLGMGQLSGELYSHYRMNQLDLCGASGLAPFYLAMERGLDVLLSLEHADPKRVAVAGLSGGGWQTIYISSLDPRVTLANPVAGYSSFLTRIDEIADLGDSEQTPTDMATIADYTHLTALRAPRPTLLTYNASDQCCFVANGALPPLLKAVEPIYLLLGHRSNLRTHVNYLPGNHNFGLDNRLQLYRMIGEHFFAGDPDYPYDEIASEDEVRSADELKVALPEENATFSSLAADLAAQLPRSADLPKPAELESWQANGREQLREVCHFRDYQIEATAGENRDLPDGVARFWRLRTGDAWTAPATELAPNNPISTVVLIADEGRESVATEASQLYKAGHRVLAVDLFHFGEAQGDERPSLYALLISCVGERPVGIQASQLAAIARWAKETHGESVAVHAVGRQTSLAALIAGALEPSSIQETTVRDSLATLKQVIEENLGVQKFPNLFCYGLLEHFDVKQLAALHVPREVRFEAADERAKSELAELADLYRAADVEHNPIP